MMLPFKPRSDFLIDAILLDNLERGQTGIKVLPP